MIKNSEISVVVPVYNEGHSLEKLCKSLLLFGFGEIIIIDDGSNDSTKSILKNLQGIIIKSNKYNRGLSSALQKGFSVASKQYVVSLDGDLQFDLSDIERFKEVIKQGYDVVCGWRVRRSDSVYKKNISRLANFFRKSITGQQIHDSGCTFRIYKRDAVKSLKLKYGYHRFIPLLLEKKGFRIGEMKVKHRKRQYGKSKFSNVRIIEGFFTLFRIIFFEKE